MDRKVFLLKRRPQYEQRTTEWYNVRRSLITASSAASLLTKNKQICKAYVEEYKLEDIFDYNDKSCNPYSSKVQFMLDKCKRGSFKGNVATYWGQKYEPVVTDIYSNLTSKDVLEFGLIIHPEYEWLGASPDGITPDGVMIEIKCPFRRKITGIPPLYYWIQVQLQLEVCGLDYCDFVEYEFTEFKTQEEFLDDTTLETKVINKGIFIQVEKQDDPDILCDPADIQYVYPERHFLDKVDDLFKWRDIQLEKLPSIIDEKYKDNIFKFTPIYWKVTDNSILRIKRDPEWFNNAKVVLESQWKQMLYYQKGNNYKKLLKTNVKEYINEGSVLKIEDEPNCLFSEDEN